MKEKIKSIIRNLLLFSHLDLTTNLKYDRLSLLIMKQIIKRDSNCIDIGCHKGEILDKILRLAPLGAHFAFEPIPHYFDKLKNKYSKNVTVYPYALFSEEGETPFQFVKNDPAYSGIKKRRYDTKTPEIEEITVEMKTLDSLIPKEIKIDFIKIDVEGAEFGVLKGAEKLLKKDKPTVIFECGLGASDYYNTNPDDLFSFIESHLEMQVNTFDRFLKKKDPLSQKEFKYYFDSGKEYYFVAYSLNF